MKKIIAFILVTALAFSISVPAWAASYTVGSDEEFSSSWDNANDNSDSKNTFNLTADIKAETQTTKSGKTYVITTGNDSTITDLGVEGKGKVEINKCNVEGDLYIGDASVTVASNCDVDIDVTNVNNHGSLTVKGNADLGDLLVTDGSVLTADEDIDADGMLVGENSSATVKGDLTINGAMVSMSVGFPDGRVVAQNNSQLTVKGDVDTEVIDASKSSDITIKGKLTTDAPDFYREDSAGGVCYPSITVVDKSTLTVENEVRGVAMVVGDSELSTGKFTGDYGDYALLVGESSKGDKSGAYTGSITSTTGTALETFGDTTARVSGNAKGLTQDVMASENSSVVVVGKANKITTYENATVTVYGLTAGSPSNNLNPTTYHVKASGTLDDALVNKCIEYAYGSDLEEQYSDMRDGFLALSNQLIKKISGIQGVLNAVGIAAVDRDKIYADMITNGEFSFEVSAAINNDFAKLCNEDSNEALKNRKVLNPYLISVSCDTLASVLEDADNDPDLLDAVEKGIKEEKKAFKKINSIIKTATKTTKAAKDTLGISQDERLLDEVFLAIDEARQAAGENSELGIKYAEFSDFLGEFAKKAKTVGKVVKWGSVVADLANYWFEDCSNELIMLETVLKTQPLTAEGYVAGLSIREAYIDKVYGIFDKICDVAGEEVSGALVDEILSASPPAELIDTAFQMGATVFGGAKRVDANTTACALTEICPAAIDAYEAAILNVKNGDTSDEAVTQVKLSYAYAKASLEELFESMITLSLKESDKNSYQRKLDKLEDMKIGEPIGKIA